MKDRLAASFPYILTVALPLAGLFLALWRLSEGDKQEALYLLLLSLVAGLVWMIALGAL